ncbi:uncharacterized protein LOC132047376 [Lycium ferocissimum]|uniref:uncharacterized protein LOC132047376 n=1 Tax=Lycium ferocissimum TaxID=112874 RepID=UPI002815AAC8|nr:uncharacterized protein LOC132047376 [Lycium ferocissimum]
MYSAGANCNGNIWFFVNDHVEVHVVSDIEQEITLKLFLQEHNKYMITNLVYAKYDDHERLKLWDRGDFNVVLNDEEKICGTPSVPQDYEDFAFCINSHELEETSFKGSPFTWWNGRAKNNSIYERLDRIAVNSHMQNWFGNVEVERLSRTGSDYAPLFTTLDNWPGDSDGNLVLNFKKKIKQVKGALSAWRKVAFSDIFKQLIIREEIVRVKEQLFEDEPTVENRCILQLAQAEMKKHLHFDEEFWKQKSGCTWFAEGDKNTKFFHSIVNGRRKRLQVKRIQDADRLWLENKEGIAQGAVQFFQDQFTQEAYNSDFSTINIVPKLITDEYNEMLCALPTEDEVKKAAFDKVRVLVVQMDYQISPNQSGFVKNRSIIDNVLLTQETVIDIRKKGKPANVIIKLDMTKAYDRVSWQFLTKVLETMGFDGAFADQIWRLLANNWCSVLLNGQSHGFFRSTREVKQSDPLSPTLFVLAADVLSRALNSLFDHEQYKG